MHKYAKARRVEENENGSSNIGKSVAPRDGTLFSNGRNKNDHQNRDQKKIQAKTLAVKQQTKGQGRQNGFDMNFHNIKI